jgi:hypothetical protein
MGRARCKKS